VVAPEADLPAALSGALSPETIVGALRDLERCAESYATWRRDVGIEMVRRLFGDAASGADLAGFDVAAIGSAGINAVLDDDPRIDRVTERLGELSALVARVAETTAQGRAAPAADVLLFMRIATEVETGLRRLLGDVWNRLANVDPLTGLGNRPAMMQRLGMESERHARHREPCCIAIIDIDDFKRINDSYGHGVGDTVLRSIAALLAASLRPYDALFRYGGDEFVLCLPNADARTAWAIAERLRLKVANWAIPTKGDATVTTSISIGVAPLSISNTPGAGDQGVDAALERADAALFAAKRLGRNAVVVGDG
jgi:diguanylate cyclase (GGDEF)-like protein